MKLVIENQLTHVKYTFEGLEDKLESRMFYTLDITLPIDIEDGIYQYTLYDSDEVKATGLMQVGNFVPEKHEYKKASTEYIQYNP